MLSWLQSRARARRITAVGAVFLLACWGIVAAPGAAAQTRLSTEIDRSPVEPELRVHEDDTLHLTLEEAVEIALQRNLNLIIQRYDREQASVAVFGNRGIFDLGINASLTLDDSEQAADTTLESAPVVTTENQQFTAGLQQLTPWGGTASFSLFGQRRDTNSNAIFNPTYIGSAGVSFTQPLLRDFGKLPTQRSLLIAQTDDTISGELFEQQVIETVRQVEGAYWGLVQARKQLEVSRESLGVARELHDRNTKRVEVGTLAPFELVQSEAGIASREGDIIRDQAAVGDAEDNLRRLLNLKTGASWGREIIPDTEAVVEEPEIDLGAAIETAIANRSELTVQQLELEKLGLDVAFFRNQVKPRLDVTLGYDTNGVTGDQVIIDPETGEVTRINRDIFNAYTPVFGADFPSWSLRFDFAFPLQNRTAKAQKIIADLALERGEVTLSDLQQAIITEVRSAVRQLEASAKQVEAARAASLAQRKSLEAERKRFENGMSTSFQVLQIQDQVTAAESAEVQAITNYRLTLVDYLRAIGRLLEESGIEIAGEQDS